MRLFWGIVLLAIVNASAALAQHSGHAADRSASTEAVPTDRATPDLMNRRMPMGPADCSEMEFWDYGAGMCLPFTMPGMPMSMAMLHGNAFLVGVSEEGPRGKKTLASPNMLMADVGRSVSDSHYVSVNLMLTLERWTFPKEGYPELLQIGEQNEDEIPYIDAQHPHSSPVMGLTFSDTISLGSAKDHLKVFFAPRGQATDGPIAFMHRPTGSVNPDAPLGHHIGQDVSHITGTVLGFSLGLGAMRYELSTFNGQEPEPAKVDLPLRTPNSYGARMIRELSETWTVMGSAATAKDPEPHDATLTHVDRYSLSTYNQFDLESEWMVHNAFIFGLVNGYDHVSALRSFLEEFWFHSDSPNQYWGRLEAVERTPAELAVTGLPNLGEPRWVTTATVGYTRRLVAGKKVELSAGGSLKKDFLLAEFRDAYGGEPISGKVFLQVSGMNMWML